MGVHDESVEELRQRSEIARSELAGTVQELRSKVSDAASDIKTLVSPSHIKEEIKSYIREEQESLRASLQRRIKEKPLQAAAIGAAVAYPAWGLIRAIPTPLLLIGAGLWLTSSKGRKTLEQASVTAADAAKAATALTSEVAEDVAARFRKGTDAIADKLDQAGGTIVSHASDLANHASDLAHRARIAAHDLRDTVASEAATAAKSVTSTAEGMVGDTSNALLRATKGVAEVGNKAKIGAEKAAYKSQSTITAFVNQNPLLVAGISAALGAFIAASLPASNAENKLLGQRADDLKDKAWDAASQGLEKVKDVAASAMQSTAGAAARQGLDTAGLQEAVETVTEGVRSVVSRGVRTALGENSVLGENTVKGRSPSQS